MNEFLNERTAVNTLFDIYKDFFDPARAEWIPLERDELREDIKNYSEIALGIDLTEAQVEKILTAYLKYKAWMDTEDAKEYTLSHVKNDLNIVI